MPTSFKVKPLQGLQDGYEDPLDFIEDSIIALDSGFNVFNEIQRILISILEPLQGLDFE
jgi:hypothetical protein